MGPHPHIRKVVKWGGLALATVLAAAWVAMVWVRVGYAFPGGLFIALESGCVWYEVSATQADPGQVVCGRNPGWMTDSANGAMAWWVDWDHGRAIPLWIPLVLVAIPTALAWRTDITAARRTRLRLCPACAYDRSGLLALTPCPECGSMGPR